MHDSICAQTCLTARIPHQLPPAACAYARLQASLSAKPWLRYQFPSAPLTDALSQLSGISPLLLMALVSIGLVHLHPFIKIASNAYCVPGIVA